MHRERLAIVLLAGALAAVIPGASSGQELATGRVLWTFDTGS